MKMIGAQLRALTLFLASPAWMVAAPSITLMLKFSPNYVPGGQNVIETVVKIICVSVSGAMAPGPLTAASANLGARRGWRAGFGLALGHTIAEFPAALLIAFSLEVFLDAVKTFLGIIGGAFLILFGFMTVKSAATLRGFSRSWADNGGRAAFLGVLLTALNPYFILWWIGVGAPLMAETKAATDAATFALFYTSHVWLDYAALTLTSAVCSFSKTSLKAYRALLVTSAAAIFYFGIEMILKTFSSAI